MKKEYDFSKGEKGKYYRKYYTGTSNWLMRKFASVSISELILLVIVVAFMTYKFLPNRGPKTTIRDFGPSPYDLHLQKLEEKKRDK
jgi:hypothetical protein